MRKGIRHRKAARLLIVLAACGMFAGGVAATASAAPVAPQDGCIPAPGGGGWLC